MSSILPLLAPLALTLSGAPEAEDPFVRFELENGIKIMVLEVADAPKQSFFTFLPAGLCHDGNSFPQYAHLAEHLMIRSTDPDLLKLDGLEINGETTASSIRLDTYADSDRWQEALQRHARWLTVSEFDPEVLEREKVRIAGEIDGTVPAGYTHKWAICAWREGYLSGEPDHVTVRGGVEQATLESVGWWFAGRLPDLESRQGVCVVAVGPIPASELKPAFEKELGGLEPRFGHRSPHFVYGGQDYDPNLPTTWDLKAHHYLEWYDLPGDEPHQRAAARLLLQRLSMALFSSADPRLGGGKALASMDVTYFEGNRLVLMISVAIDAKCDVEQLQGSLRKVIDGLLESNRGLPDVEATAQMLRMQFAGLPNFKHLRKQLGSNPLADLVEAQVALNLMTEEWQLRMTIPEFLEELEGLKTEHVADVAKFLAKGKRESLRFSPGP